jgi:hypothetical protein
LKYYIKKKIRCRETNKATMREIKRAYLDLKVERGQRRDAGNAEPVGLARHDGEHRRGALRVGGVACPSRHPGAAEPPATTADSAFAERLGRSAKSDLRSAKSLPSVALGKEVPAKKRSAKASLPSVFYRALGKAFA